MKIWKDGVVREMTEEEIAELEKMEEPLPDDFNSKESEVQE